MPWNGTAPDQTFIRTDGTRSGADTWQQAEAAGVDIVALDHDLHDEDIADAINACLKRDGGNQALATLQLAGFGAAFDADGDVVIKAGPAGDLGFHYGSASAELFSFLATAMSAQADGIRFIAATAGASPTIAAFGASTTVNLEIRPKGSGQVVIADPDGLAIARFAFPATAEVAAGLKLLAASAGMSPTIEAFGAAADVDLTLRPQGDARVVIDGKLGFNGFVGPDADGTNGQALLTDGAGTLSFGDAGMGALVAAATAANSVALDFTLNTSYDDFVVVFDHLCPATAAAASVSLRTSTDGGATFATAAGSYVFMSMGLRGTADAAVTDSNQWDSAADAIEVIQSVSTIAAGQDGASGTLAIHGARDAGRRTQIDFRAFAIRNTDGSGLGIQVGGGYRRVAEDNNAIRIELGPGITIAAGRAKLYGLKK